MKQPRAVPDFTTAPNSVSGTTVTGDQLANGRRRLTMTYPVSIGGHHIEQRSVAFILTDSDRRELGEWLLNGAAGNSDRSGQERQ
jgi:hypothetical protein